MPPLSTSWHRTGPCLAVLATVAIAFAGVTIPAYRLGEQCAEERRFFPSYRVPSQFEAFASCGMDYAANSAEANDVVFIGDSTCLTGVRTRQFEQLTGLSAYNLGTVFAIQIDGYILALANVPRASPGTPTGSALPSANRDRTATGSSRAVSSQECQKFAERARTLPLVLWQERGIPSTIASGAPERQHPPRPDDDFGSV